jgi:hypothetical protein
MFMRSQQLIVKAKWEIIFLKKTWKQFGWKKMLKYIWNDFKEKKTLEKPAKSY